jgi:hypothetical protein
VGGCRSEGAEGAHGPVARRRGDLGT